MSPVDLVLVNFEIMQEIVGFGAELTTVLLDTFFRVIIGLILVLDAFRHNKQLMRIPALSGVFLAIFGMNFVTIFPVILVTIFPVILVSIFPRVINRPYRQLASHPINLVIGLLQFSLHYSILLVESRIAVFEAVVLGLEDG